MSRGLILIALFAGGCGSPQPPAQGPHGDRARLEVVVADCDRGARHTGCDAARRELAAVRRDARQARYRDAL